MPRFVPSTGLLQSPNQCVAVRIERKDGVIHGLSNSPVSFTMDGLLYRAEVGGDVANIESQTGTSVDNTEITTLIDDAVAYLQTEDVVGMRFEGSRWTIYLTDPTQPSYVDPDDDTVKPNAMIYGRYRLRKTRFKESSMVMELVGLLSFLKQTSGRVYLSYCDVLSFGDKRCDPHQTIRAALSADRTVDARIDLFHADFAGDARPAGFYSRGDATWVTGQNAGMRTSIKKHEIVSGKARITWSLPPPFPVQAGDVATLCFGCDRRNATCKSVPNVNSPNGTNFINNQAQDLPSQDELQVIAK